jgi:hypothetical protein
MEIDRRLIDAAGHLLQDDSLMVYKPTRAGFTTSAVIAAKERGKRILCIVPTNRISEETIFKASEGTVVIVPANYTCLILNDEIKNDKFLAKLPLPLPLCEECLFLNACPVTKILSSDKPVISITYSKLTALMLSKSKTAKNILKKLSSVDIVLMDEAHTISLPAIVRIAASIDVQIPIGYPSISKILSKFNDLKEKFKEKIEQLKKEGDRGHVGRNLSKRVANDYHLSFKQISAAWNELFKLAKKRKEIGLQERDILIIRDIISLMSSFVIALSYLRERDNDKGKIYLTGNYWISQRALSDFLSQRVPGATHIYVSGTLVEPHPNFFSELSGKDVLDMVFPDIRGTNDKMLIYYDTWKLNSHNFGKNFDRIIERIKEICRSHTGKQVYIVAPNARIARTIRKRLKEDLGETAPLVDYYRSDRTIGVENSARICIAIGLAELPSNTYDHQARGISDEERWIDSQRLRRESVDAATFQSWSRVKDPAGLEESFVYCIGVREDQARDVVKWGPGRQLKLEKIKEYKLPDGTSGRKPLFRVTCRELIKPPRILDGTKKRSLRAGCNIEDVIENVEKYEPNLIISFFGDILPININRQNISKLGIYNNTRDDFEVSSTSAVLTALLAARFDCYATQNHTPDAGGKYGYNKRIKNFLAKPWILKNHVQGNNTVGFYQIGLDGKVKWICFDIDDHKGERGPEAIKADLQKLFDVLAKYEIPFLLEASGSPNSYHVWILLKPTQTLNAYVFSRQISTEADIKCEIFPKNKSLNKDGKYGNLVKGPLGINRKTGIKSQFLDPTTFQPYPDFVPIPGIVHLREVSESEECHAKSNKREARCPPNRRERSAHVPMRVGHEMRSCMKSLLASKTPLEGSEGHEMRVAIAAEAWNIGLSVDQTIELFKGQPDFNPETTRRHVEYIYSQGYYPYKCDTLREKCRSLISTYCIKCPENRLDDFSS